MEEERNGAAWMRDCLLNAPTMAGAVQRLQSHCRLGIRHFSAVRVAVPLDQVKKMEARIVELESALDRELCPEVEVIRL